MEAWNVPTSGVPSRGGRDGRRGPDGPAILEQRTLSPDGSSGYGKSPGGSLPLSGLAITGCTVYGIRISDDPTNSDPSAALYLTATDLTVTSDVVGVQVENARASATITQSDLSSNSSFGANNIGGALSATCDWWGSATGPANAISNPGGTGSPVSAAVVFAPAGNDTDGLETGTTAWVA